MKVTKNFSASEFDCNDGSLMPEDVMINVIELAEQLQILRDHIGKPIRINSAYRSKEYNRRIGGVKNSMHIIGKAADLVASGMSARELNGVIIDLIRDGKMKEGGVGLYVSQGFVHYDIRGTRARWRK